MNGYAILLVDDEEIVLKTVGTELKDRGYNVTLAESGEEAVELLRSKTDGNQNNHQPPIQYPQPTQSTFDIVITDLLMEGMDGLKVLKEAKKISPDTMVIILTGHGDLTSAIAAIRLNADDYILKPCEMDELLYRISRCIKTLELNRKIKLYEKLLRVCCACNKIFDGIGKEPGTGGWIPMEAYLGKKANIEFTHGYCPECYEKTMKEAGLESGEKHE